MPKRTVASTIKAPVVTDSPKTILLLNNSKKAIRFLEELKNKWMIG
ncbi:hypothetical protein [Metabacillus sp. 84]